MVIQRLRVIVIALAITNKHKAYTPVACNPAWALLHGCNSCYYIPWRFLFATKQRRAIDALQVHDCQA